MRIGKLQLGNVVVVIRSFDKLQTCLSSVNTFGRRMGHIDRISQLCKTCVARFVGGVQEIVVQKLKLVFL